MAHLIENHNTFIKDLQTLGPAGVSLSLCLMESTRLGMYVDEGMFCATITTDYSVGIFRVKVVTFQPHMRDQLDIPRTYLTTLAENCQ